MPEHWDVVHSEERNGFNIELAFTDEQDDPRGHFDSGDAEADQEVFDKIANGTYLWFCARLRVYKAGVVLGDDYLGGCCYASAADFMAEGGYYEDMMHEAMTRAKDKLAELVAS